MFLLPWLVDFDADGYKGIDDPDDFDPDNPVNAEGQAKEDKKERERKQEKSKRDAEQEKTKREHQANSSAAAADSLAASTATGTMALSATVTDYLPYALGAAAIVLVALIARK